MGVRRVDSGRGCLQEGIVEIDDIWLCLLAGWATKSRQLMTNMGHPFICLM